MASRVADQTEIPLTCPNCASTQLMSLAALEKGIFKCGACAKTETTEKAQWTRLRSEVEDVLQKAWGSHG